MPEQITTDDPRSILEASEENSYESGRNREFADVASTVPRILAWCMEGKTLAAIGMRVHIAAIKLQVDPLNGATQDQLAKLAGWGRSGVNNLAIQFTETFGIRGLNDRSDSTRQACAESYRRRFKQGRDSCIQSSLPRTLRLRPRLLEAGC